MNQRIQENIARPSKNFRLFMEESISEAENLISRLRFINETLTTLYDADRSSINHAFHRYGDGVEYYLVEWATEGFGYNGIIEPLARIKDDFLSILKFMSDKDYETQRFVRKLISWSVDYAKQAISNFSTTKTENKTIEELLEDIEKFYKSGELYSSWIDEFGGDNKEFPEETTDLVGEIPKIYRKTRSLLEKVFEYGTALLYQLSGQAPPYEDIETLYHASVVARDLFYRGFSKIGSKQVAGIGQFGPVLKRTSFTSAEWVAQEIARALLEAVYIAHGRITIEHILFHSIEDGVIDKVSNFFTSSYGFRIEDIYAIHHTMDAYRWYLGFAEGADKRYNPLFVGDMESLMETLKTIDPDDVGYVATTIDMTHPDIEYLGSMYEFRVPASAILENEYWVRAETDWL